MQNNFVSFDREKSEITVHLAGGNVIIGKNDVDISYFSGGPGGQNVNKNMSGVRLIYHIPEGYLINSSKTREIVTKSINQRKKEQNLIQAFEQLAYKLHRYFYTAPDRKKTKIPKGSKEKRLKGKKMRSVKKQYRGNIGDEL